MVRKGGAGEWMKTIQPSALAVSDNHTRPSSPALRTPNESKGEQPHSSDRPFKQSHAWCHVEDGIRRTRIRQEQRRSLSLHERPSLQEIRSKVSCPVQVDQLSRTELRDLKTPPATTLRELPRPRIRYPRFDSTEFPWAPGWIPFVYAPPE